jgi:uncharacterized protein (DUF983 family)
MVSVAKELVQGVTRPRSYRETWSAVERWLPTRCDHCGGRVVRTDPMAAKSCNRCGLWAE